MSKVDIALAVINTNDVSEVNDINESNCKVTTKDVKPADFETAISASGYGKFNIILYILSIAAGWSSVFETTTMSYVFPAAECDLELSLSHKGLLNAITYAGMISSAFLWGYLCDSLGRKKLLVIGFLLDAFFCLIATSAQTLTQLMIAKFLGGFTINGPFAALTAYLSEFHCAKHRARIQMVLGIIFSAGNLILPLLALGILPLDINFKIGNSVFHSWNLYLLVCSLPALISGLSFICMPESPKFLMTIGRNDKALEVFKKVYAINTGESMNSYPIKELIIESKISLKGVIKQEVIVEKISKIEALKQGFQQFRLLFLPPHLSKICIVFLMQCLIMMSLNTLRLWLPQIYQAMNDYQFSNNKTASLCEMLEVFQPNNQTTNVTTCTVNTNNSQVYTNSMIVAATSIIGYITAGTLINSVGKKNLLNTLGIISGTVAMTMYYATNIPSTIALSAAFIAFGSVGINVILAVVVDLFPTTLRTMAVSLTMMFGRLGAAFGNILFPFLLESGCAPPFFTVGSVMIGCAFLTYFLPNTDMKPLE